jgi:hypothetical protein
MISTILKPSATVWTIFRQCSSTTLFTHFFFAVAFFFLPLPISTVAATSRPPMLVNTKSGSFPRFIMRAANLRKQFFRVPGIQFLGLGGAGSALV